MIKMSDEKPKVKYTDFDPNVQAILEEMCNRVGMTIEDVDFNDSQWYTKKEWTEFEQMDFEEWLYDYLKTNNEARNNVMAFPRKNSKLIRKTAKYWISNYGWKTKKE